MDTVRYSPPTATGKTYKKIVPGAIDKDWDDEANAPTEPRYAPHLPQGRMPQVSSTQQRYLRHRAELSSSRQDTHGPLSNLVHRCSPCGRQRLLGSEGEVIIQKSHVWKQCIELKVVNSPSPLGQRRIFTGRVVGLQLRSTC